MAELPSIVFLGAGQIAEAIIGGVLDSRLVRPEQITATDVRHDRLEELSGGEQQRVALARALVHDPLLILADEPTGNLDEETGAQVLSLLARLTREQNRTLLMVTHNLEATSHADRVLRLSHGKLIEEHSW